MNWAITIVAAVGSGLVGSVMGWQVGLGIFLLWATIPSMWR